MNQKTAVASGFSQMEQEPTRLGNHWNVSQEFLDKNSFLVARGFPGLQYLPIYHLWTVFSGGFVKDNELRQDPSSVEELKQMVVESALNAAFWKM